MHHGKSARCTVLVDSGNLLRDPLTGREVILLSRDGEVSRWRIADGECLGRVILSEYSSRGISLRSKESRILCPEGSLLEIDTYYNGFLLDLSGGGLVMKTRIPHCFGYDPQEDRYLVAESRYSERNTTLGSFPRYSVETMVEMARNRLGRQEISHSFPG